MRPRIYCIAALLLCVPAAHARIGETEAQIEARYGKPIKMLGGPPPGLAGTKQYKSAGLEIFVTFIDGISESEFYSKPYGKLDRSEVDALLEANAGGKKWEQLDKNHPLYSWSDARWLIGDLSEFKIADFDDIQGRLTIMAKKSLDASKAASAAAAKEKLKGF